MHRKRRLLLPQVGHMNEHLKLFCYSIDNPVMLSSLVDAEPNPALDNYNENWKAVHENPNDFTAWTVLIASAEKLVRAGCNQQAASFTLRQVKVCNACRMIWKG